MITYYKAINGWQKIEYANQCKEEMIFGRCQGKEGHEGNHWRYDSNGSYLWSSLRKDLKPYETAGGSIPPGHPSYINPADKYDEYYIRHNEVTEVTDEDLIERLENDEDMGPDIAIY